MSAHHGPSISAIDSAGTGGWHAGELPDARTLKVGERRGYRFDGIRARQVCDSDFDRFDVLFAMDRQNHTDLLRRCPVGLESKVQLFLRNVPGVPDQVPDPYYGTLEDFESMYDLLERACQYHLQRLSLSGGS